MDDYLAKPFSRAALREVLARWLPAGAAAATPAPVETLVPATADVLDRGTLNALRALPRKGTKDMLSHIVERYLTNSRELVGELRARHTRVREELQFEMRRSA